LHVIGGPLLGQIKDIIEGDNIFTP